MSNDPYPSAAILHAETVADQMLLEHDHNTQIFRTAVIKCLATIAPLYWPLGSPCAGTDIMDVEATLRSWLLPVDAGKLDAEAWDQALQQATTV